MFAKLHARLGDFWWYSLMLFCACRAADLLNAFVGLWLVPKYVGLEELGAVMPLAQFANFLAIPVAAFASTFRNELSRLSIGREFGKLKTLLRGVFVATAIFLFVAIVASRFLLPAFLERIRLVEGSLGIVIIATSFVSAVAPIYANALQALKKFKAQSILSIIGAPIRLIVMLVAMPFRPISGYFVGQSSTPVFNIFASLISLRKELSVKAEPYWDKATLKKFSSIFTVFLIWTITGSLYSLVETTVIRQRLPDLDSAGYYMATRFSEIANYLFCAICFAIFPFTAELAAKKKDTRPLILKSAAATIAFSALVALPFFFAGRPLLSILPNGDQYAAYWWAIPWLIGIGSLMSFIVLYTTGEISANRFGFLKWLLPCNLVYPILLLLVSGHGHLANIIPASWSNFLTAHNIYSLETMLWWMTAITVIRALVCFTLMMRRTTHID